MPRFSGGRGGSGGKRSGSRGDDSRGGQRRDGRVASQQRGGGERSQVVAAAAFGDAIERTAARAARGRNVRELLEGIGTPARA